jgi:hypothetical protein
MRSALHLQLEVPDRVRLGSDFRDILDARAIMQEQCCQPLLSQNIVPWKVMVQPGEGDFGMPVAGYVAPERDRDTGREVSGRRPPQVGLADLPHAARERTWAHEVLAGVETQQFRNIRDRPITAENPAQGRLRVKGSVHDSSMIPRLPDHRPRKTSAHSGRTANRGGGAHSVSDAVCAVSQEERRPTSFRVADARNPAVAKPALRDAAPAAR